MVRPWCSTLVILVVQNITITVSNYYLEQDNTNLTTISDHVIMITILREHYWKQFLQAQLAKAIKNIGGITVEPILSVIQHARIMMSVNLMSVN